MNSLRYVLISCFIMNALFIHAQERQKTEANSDLSLFTLKQGLPFTNISKVIQTKDGFIWVSGIEGTCRFNGYLFEEVGADIGLPKMQDMVYDSTKNILYFASPQKMISFDGNEFKVYTAKDGYRINGMDGQIISFMDADSKGTIWIGSMTPFVDKRFNGGLTKFENGDFTVYDSTTFPLDNVNNFIETPYDDILFSSSGHNTQTREGAFIALYKNGVFRRIDESDGIDLQDANIFPRSQVTAIDKEGNLWLAFTGQFNSGNAHTNAGVMMYDGNAFHQFPELNDMLGKDRFPVEVYYSTSLDKLFLTTAKINGEVFDGNNKSVFEFENGKWKPSDILKDIYPIRDLKSGNALADFKYSNTFLVRQNKYFPERLILISTNNSQSSKYTDQLFCFENGRLKKLDAFDSGFGNEINDGFIMSNNGGIAIFYPNYCQMLTAKDGLLQVQSGIPTLYTDLSGMVWISFSYSELPAYASSAEVGMNVWDGKKLRSITEKDGLASNVTFEIMQDSLQRIWIATSKGVTMAREIANSRGEQIIKLSDIPDQEGKPYNTSSFLETKDGVIYSWENYVRPGENNLTPADYFFGRLDGEKFVRINSPFSDADNQKPFQLFDLIEDHEGRLWMFGIFSDNLKDITTAPSKIMIYDGKSWSKPPESWHVPSDQLHYVGSLKEGIYFLTAGGFYDFNGEQFINLSDSVNENADFRILKGASVVGTATHIAAGGNLYIRLRNRGLVIFDGTDLAFYTKKEGLPTSNLSNPIIDKFRGNVCFSSPLGAVLITGNQFQTFYTDDNIVSGGPYTSAMDGFGNLLEFYNGVGLYINKSVAKSYPLKICSISIAGKSYYYSYPNRIPFSQNSFLFSYTAPNYKDPQQTTYQHFLEGFDKDWSRPGNIAFAEYQNLPSGKYTFRVRGITSNGEKTNEDSYSFVISPPFWRAWWAYIIYGLIFAAGVFAVDRIQRRRLLERERKQANQKELAQAKEIEKAYHQLKTTQSQLLHAEKMASLGELTAGIAHEIQNPLNFVNNFSEVNTELIAELKEQIDKGDMIEVKALAENINENELKINHHGKRADAIVKGMLQHSRSSNNHKEMTDINALADEYLRLSYHGLRAKDKSFNAEYMLDQDPALPLVNVVPQDIGRVILNLINNAFYAVNTRRLNSVKPQNIAAPQNGYTPTVTVTTKNLSDKVEIHVKDNGNGIPKNVLEKVFQPFFTTKPAGEGTGLGLSLSYDIVKAHGGLIKLDTKEGEGTEFTIVLPK